MLYAVANIVTKEPKDRTFRYKKYSFDFENII